MCKMEQLDSCTELRSQDSVTSTQLKFGVDRILSDEISSDKSRDKSRGEVNHPCRLPYPVVEVCSGYSGRTPSGHIIHVPKPIRPSGSKTNIVLASHRSPPQNTLNLEPKRKRSWSRAVFSNLQRKGLERRFQLQKYITKPDRRQLAATLGLTDAQVKVWFQNRRMKWRHSKMIAQVADSTQRDDLDSGCSTTTITNQD